MFFEDCKTIKTTWEVWNAIKQAHEKDLTVWASYSAPQGNPNGRHDQGRMETAYGFHNGDFPIMWAETTWDLVRLDNGEFDSSRKNEKHKYFLAIPEKDDDY